MLWEVATYFSNMIYTTRSEHLDPLIFDARKLCNVQKVFCD